MVDLRSLFGNGYWVGFSTNYFTMWLLVLGLRMTQAEPSCVLLKPRLLKIIQACFKL